MPYKDKTKLYAAQLAHRNRNKKLLRELLLESACVDCSNNDIRVLEFDHLPEYKKTTEVSRMVCGSTYSWKRIKEEIDKCQIVCANCHKIRTLERLPFDSYRLN